MERRQFIKTGSMAAAGVGLTAMQFPLFGRQLGANDKVLIGVMGTNGRGLEHIKSYTRIPGVELGWICDVEDTARNKGLDLVEKITGKRPVAVTDIRKLLAQKDLDALTIAAPDHWHAPAAILACAAGKHVYVEKPCGHNPAEGEALVKAARKYKRQVQMGAQRRSMPRLKEAMQQVHQGVIGRPYFAKGWYANNRKPIGIGKVIPVPTNLNWDLWQGPAPAQDYRDNLVHYNWHWFWNWGTGEACNNGTHEIDCMRWALGVDYPVKVTSVGGRFAAKDDWQTPDTQTISFEFANNTAIAWEGISCNNYSVQGSGRGFVIYGDKGSLVNKGGDDYKIFDAGNKLIAESKDSATTDTINTAGPGESLDIHHFKNFINGIQTGEALNGEIEEGHKSVLLCHLGNIAQRTGRTLHCNPADGGRIVNDKEAMQLWSREYRKEYFGG